MLAWLPSAPIYLHYRYEPVCWHKRRPASLLADTTMYTQPKHVTEATHLALLSRNTHNLSNNKIELHHTTNDRYKSKTTILLYLPPMLVRVLRDHADSHTANRRSNKMCGVCIWNFTVYHFLHSI